MAIIFNAFSEVKAQAWAELQLGLVLKIRLNPTFLGTSATFKNAVCFRKRQLLKTDVKPR